jgi:hypothetical protein
MEILFLFAAAGVSAAIGGCISRWVSGSPNPGLLLGLLFGPLGWIIALTSGDSRPTCPACRCWVVRGASACPHCGQRMTPTA